MAQPSITSEPDIDQSPSSTPRYVPSPLLASPPNNSLAPSTPSIATPPPSIGPSTPTLTSPNATDLIFARAMLALEENCRERLHKANFVHDTAVRNADTDKQRKQEQITIRLNKDTAKYRKQLAKQPVKLAEMLAHMATEETKAKSRQEIPYVQSCAAAAAILRQDTNNVEAFRARRQNELRAELKTRLVRAHSRAHKESRPTGCFTRRVHHLNDTSELTC
ncbi:hypothetical protein K457DRAFT_121791 [Linnemannia elongata AG-77]|uniref:Uncharacterized protein n=1 Tax=Linnemannia elongata AG-77 TaxID=1314771 RepID=A0A197KA71_9FUNG|nr:hypothetical protein K457DRAFT_121791 [Linnemannia elongata AG-77]